MHSDHGLCLKLKGKSKRFFTATALTLGAPKPCKAQFNEQVERLSESIWKASMLALRSRRPDVGHSLAPPPNLHNEELHSGPRCRAAKTSWNSYCQTPNRIACWGVRTLLEGANQKVATRTSHDYSEYNDHSSSSWFEITMHQGSMGGPNLSALPQWINGPLHTSRYHNHFNQKADRALISREPTSSGLPAACFKDPSTTWRW